MTYYEKNLEDRTTEFGKRVVRMCQVLTKNSINSPLVSQVIRSAGSIGANYREANDSLGKKDFLHRMRISRKEAKEYLHWLEIIEEANPDLRPRMQDLKQENRELKSMLSTIINKGEKKNRDESNKK